MIQAYFLYLQFEGAVNLDEVESLCPVDAGRYQYMKKKQKELEPIIKTYRQ